MLPFFPFSKLATLNYKAFLAFGFYRSIGLLSNLTHLLRLTNYFMVSVLGRKYLSVFSSVLQF